VIRNLWQRFALHMVARYEDEARLCKLGGDWYGSYRYSNAAAWWAARAARKEA
jgi:hypothetical protein